jgi:Protein of unknown function (DUF3455)
MEESMTSSKNRTMFHAVMAMAVVVPMTGCAMGTGEPVGSEGEALSSKTPPAVPPALAVPDGNKLAFYFDALGVQIYVCQQVAAGYGWVFRAPQATLFNRGEQVAGTHYVGPTWEANDGSKVVGARVAGFAADPSAIPWLLLVAVSHDGDGRMANVTFIQRLDTAGGLAPAKVCDAAHAGSVEGVDYAATYFFYKAVDATEE